MASPNVIDFNCVGSHTVAALYKSIVLFNGASSLTNFSRKYCNPGLTHFLTCSRSSAAVVNRDELIFSSSQNRFCVSSFSSLTRSNLTLTLAEVSLKHLTRLGLYSTLSWVKHTLLPDRPVTMTPASTFTVCECVRTNNLKKRTLCLFTTCIGSDSKLFVRPSNQA